MSDDIQHIKNSIDIVQLIGETIALTKKGESYRGAISASSKSGSSLIVNPKQQIFNDTASEVGGDVYSWIAYVEGLDIKHDFPKILSIAAKKAGVALSHHTEHPDSQQVFTILQAAANYYHSQLTEEHRRYITETWGISNETIDKLLIGFAPVKMSLEAELSGVFQNDDLKKSGLFYADGTILTDVFRGRIIFPYWKSKKVVYFIGRDPKWNKDSQHGKYIKQPVHTESRPYISEVIDNNVFYGEDTIKRQDTCMITEGVTDCIMANQSGIPCISPVTVRIKESEKEHALELVKRIECVLVCNDNENNNAGKEGAIATAEYLESNGVSVELIELPKHNDVDKIDLAEFLIKHDSTTLLSLPRNNVWSIKLQTVTVPSDAIGKAKTLLRFIGSDLAEMDETIREVFVKNDVRVKFDISKSEINKLLKKAESQSHDAVELDNQFFDEHGKLKVKSLSKYVMSLSNFITLADNKNLYHYDNGIYKLRGEDLITKIVQNALGDDSKIQHTNEVIHYIKYETLIPRNTINTDSYRIPLINGVYNLTNDVLEPHSPDNIFIHQVPVKYDRDAECPVFNKFISEITDPTKPQDILTILEVIGYCLIPDTRIQRALMCVGSGSNGKSKLLEAIGAFIGADNTSAQSLQKLENSPYSTSELFGKLVNIFPDLASSAIYENSTFKMLTGDEGSITAERKYEHPFSFKNTARLIFSANKLPPVPADDMAYMRRWLLIEFPNKFEGDAIDVNLGAKLATAEEQSGLLNLTITALKQVLKNGDYTNIQTTKEINRLYRVNSDPIAAFADECIVASESDTWKIYIYEHYVNWCKENEIEPKKEPIFAKRFIKVGFVKNKESFTGSNGKRNTIWENCSIKQSVRVKENYPAVENQQQADYTAGWQGKNELCSSMEKNIKNENEKINMHICKQGEFYPATLPYSPKTSRPSAFKIRQGKIGENEVTQTAEIDMNYLTNTINLYKIKMHPSGIIPNIEQFALIVRNQNKELKDVFSVDDVIEVVKKLSRDGWK